MVKKYKTPKTNAEGYALVLAFYGGNKTAMAKALDCTRQIVHRWEALGIPNQRLDEISKATGYPKEHIKPNPY